MYKNKEELKKDKCQINDKPGKMLNLFCSPKVKQRLINDHEVDYENSNELSITKVENGYIIPVSVSEQKIISNGAFYFALYGGVVDKDLNFVESSQIEDGRCENSGMLIGANPNFSKDDIDSIDECVIYIGDFKNHPAHLYLESISRLWILLINPEYKNYKIAYLGKNDSQSPEFFDFFFESLGIKKENLLKITKTTKFREIIIPEASFKLNLNYHKMYARLIEQIKQSVIPATYKKVYFAKQQDKNFGENLAIDIFKKNGYNVFLPEDLSMKEKLSILSGCEEFAAQNGSNAHFSVFLSDGAKLTVLNRSADIHYVQTQIDQMKNLNVTYIDSFCDLLPTWLSLGPFVFQYTEHLEQWLVSKNMIFDKKELIEQLIPNQNKTLRAWIKTYSCQDKMDLIQNSINTKSILPRDFLYIVNSLLSKDKKDKNMKNKFKNIFNAKRAKINRILTVLGLKIKFKREKQGNKYNISSINKKELDKQIKTFKEFGLNKEIRDEKIILCVTSYPERMYDMHYSIFSLLNQTIKPDKLILRLAKTEFVNGEKDVPKKILAFKKFGLEIKFWEPVKSFKKIIPALVEYPNDIIVTADDDIYYQSEWLERLYKAYLKDKNSVHCHRAHKVVIKDGKFDSYLNWPKCLENVEPDFCSFLTSVGGVLYPPNICHKDATNQDIFTELCPNQDDIWMWAMTILNLKKVNVVENNYNNDLIYINPERELGLNGETTLAHSNLQDNNDIQLSNLLNHYPQILKILGVQ